MTVTYIVDLTDDVYPHLGFTGTPADGGVQLQGYINAATVIIEDIVGHVIPVTLDEFYSGGQPGGIGDITIYLRELPVLTVNTIQEIIGLVGYNITLQPVGQPVDNYGFTFDGDTGAVVRRSAGSAPYPWYANIDNIEVNYTAGRAAVPANVRMATLELIKDMYVPDQEAFGSASSYVPSTMSAQDYAPVTTPSGYLVPPHVYAWCIPSISGRHPFGFA